MLLTKAAGLGDQVTLAVYPSPAATLVSGTFPGSGTLNPVIAAMLITVGSAEALGVTFSCETNGVVGSLVITGTR